jgi:hypothetical protein
MTDHGEHDGFHPVTSDDEAWIETVWFPFWIPERGLTVYPRVVFQPNSGQYRGSVAVWSGADELLYEAPLAGQFSQWAELGDLRDLSLPGGLRFECLRPGERYRVRYEQPECAFDIDFSALGPPAYPDPGDSPGMFAGHLDQHGRVTGSVQLAGESLSVDCWTVRDRSWGPRVVRNDLRLGNAHATGAEQAFFAYLQQDEAGRERVRGGTHWVGGEERTLVAGERTTTWQDGWPASLRIEATDSRGDRLCAEGRCLNRRAVVANPELYAVLNLVSWEVDGARLWGENHDVWSRTAWVSAGRAPLEGGH